MTSRKRTKIIQTNDTPWIKIDNKTYTLPGNRKDNYKDLNQYKETVISELRFIGREDAELAISYIKTCKNRKEIDKIIEHHKKSMP
jgi:hypothetical protein